MEGLDLHRETAVYVLEAKIPSRGVSRLNDIEELGVCVCVEEGEGGGLAPVCEKIWVEICGWIAFDGGEGWMGLQVQVVFGC